MVLARDGYFYVGGKTTSGRRPHLCRRSDVRRISHPGATDASVSDRHGAWRHALGHEIYRHARWPRRLGAIFRAPRLCGLCRRSAGPRPVGLFGRGLRPLAMSPTWKAGMRRYLAQEKFKLWPQAHLHTQWPGSGAPDDPVTIADGVELSAGDRGFHQAAIPQPRCTGGAVRQDRPCHTDGALAGRRLRLAGGRRAAATGQGDRRRRAEWSAVLRRRLHRRAGLVQAGQARAALWTERRAARLFAAGQRRLRARQWCRRRRRTVPIWCAAGCRRSRRGSFPTCKKCRSWC